MVAISVRRRSATSSRSPLSPAPSTERLRCAAAEPRGRRAAARRAPAPRRPRRRRPRGVPRARARARRRWRRRRRARSRRRRRRRSGPGRRRRSRAARRRRTTAAAVRRSSPGRVASPAPVPTRVSGRQDRLELVADAEEAHPAAGVGTEHRERGQRRAGDDVDRVGGDVAAQASARPAQPPRARSATTASAADPTPSSSAEASVLASTAAATSSISGAQAQARPSSRSAKLAPRRRQISAASARQERARLRAAAATTCSRLGRGSSRSWRSATASGSRSDPEVISLPLTSSGASTPRRSSTVGAMSVVDHDPVGAGRARGQVALEALARDPGGEQLLVRAGAGGDRDQQVVGAKRGREPVELAEPGPARR